MQYGELIGYQTIVDNKAVFVNNYGEIGYDVDWLLFNRQGIITSLLLMTLTTSLLYCSAQWL